eukprot:5271082-Prymnesium_polylepis.1
METPSHVCQMAAVVEQVDVSSGRANAIAIVAMNIICAQTHARHVRRQRMAVCVASRHTSRR